MLDSSDRKLKKRENKFVLREVRIVTCVGADGVYWLGRGTGFPGVLKMFYLLICFFTQAHTYLHMYVKIQEVVYLWYIHFIVSMLYLHNKIFNKIIA